MGLTILPRCGDCPARVREAHPIARLWRRVRCSILGRYTKATKPCSIDATTALKLEAHFATVRLARGLESGERHYVDLVENGLARTVEITPAGVYEDGSVRWKVTSRG